MARMKLKSRIRVAGNFFRILRGETRRYRRGNRRFNSLPIPDVINLELHQHFISTPLIISNFLNRVRFIFADK